LTGEARIAGALIVALGWPLLCVRVTWLVLHRVVPATATATAQLTAGAGLMILVSFATLVTRPVDRLRSPATWIDATSVVVPSVVAFLILAATAGTPRAILLTPFAFATFAAALAEEAVFRQYLPARLASVLRGVKARPSLTAVAIVVIPQLSFAVAHAENSAFAGASGREFAGLFIGGVLYQGVARVGGLWAAAGVHAALNLTIAVQR
jgi:membrane protease YdiL (CAAX protease family)